MQIGTNTVEMLCTFYSEIFKTFMERKKIQP